MLLLMFVFAEPYVVQSMIVPLLLMIQSIVLRQSTVVSAAAGSFGRRVSVSAFHHHRPLSVVRNFRQLNHNGIRTTKEITSQQHLFPSNYNYVRRSGRLFVTAPTETSKDNSSSDATAIEDDSNDTDEDPNTMRLSAIKQELKENDIRFNDCFDKDSLVARLIEARVDPEKFKNVQKQASTRQTNQQQEHQPQPKTKVVVKMDESSVAEEVKLMSVKELRTELAQRNIRWSGMIEKSELIAAVVAARVAVGDFSPSGCLSPGHVCDMDDEANIRKEMNAAAATPLLIDVYATWCGPCKIMATEIQQACVEWNDAIRVLKFDSDKFPSLSSELRIAGLPTLLLYSSEGKEVARFEGAMAKGQLMEWVNANKN